MAKEMKFEDFLNHCGMLDEYLSTAGAGAQSDIRYQEISEEIHALYKDFPRVAEVLDNVHAENLSEKECDVLLDVLHLKNEAVELEARMVYFQGCKDCVGYLKNMKML